MSELPRIAWLDKGMAFLQRPKVIWGIGLLAALILGAAAAGFPYLALAAALGVPLALLALYYADWALLFVAAYTPFEEFVLKWVPGQLYTLLRFAPEALMMAILAVLLLRNLQRGRLWRSTPLDLPLVLFLIISALSALWNDVPVSVWLLGVREYSRYIVVFYLVVQAGFTDRFHRLIVKALLIAAAVEVSVGLAQAVIGDPLGRLLIPRDVTVVGTVVREGFTQALGGRTYIFGTTSRYAVLGGFLVSFLLIALGLYSANLNSKRRVAGRQWMLLLFMAGAGLVLLLTFSRTSWAMFYLGWVVILLLQRQSRALLATVVLPLVLIVVLLSTVYFFGSVKLQAGTESPLARFLETFSEESIFALQRGGRLYTVLVIVPAILQRFPWLGLGPGTIASIATGGGTLTAGLYPQYSHEGWLGDMDPVGIQYLHDVGWASILAQVGVLGLLFFAWAVARLGMLAWQVYRQAQDSFWRGLALGYLALVIVYVVAHFSVFWFILRPVSLYFWLFGGLLAAYGQTSSEGTHRESTDDQQVPLSFRRQ